LSLSRTARDRRGIGLVVICWAVARLSACCSRRSMLKSSSRMESSVSQGEAVGRRPKARRIDGIKLAFLQRMRGFGAVHIAWQARDAGIAVRTQPQLPFAVSASRLRGDGIDHERSSGTAMDTELP